MLHIETMHKDFNDPGDLKKNKQFCFLNIELLLQV